MTLSQKSLAHHMVGKIAPEGFTVGDLARNQPNIGLLGIVLGDDEFPTLATEGVDIKIDLKIMKVIVGGKSFTFNMDDMELALIRNGGITNLETKCSQADGGKRCRE
jgi:3-isopropylmalate dehydratase small subunit